MAVKASELFVFAGAGASLSMPSNLPVFDALRNEVLNQLDLKRYMWRKDDVEESDPQKVAEALAPELFMLGLSEAHVNVESWLGDVLSGTQPNAVHYTLAALAAAGSRVWTVNFDTLIEQASGNALRTVAWPADPLPDTQLLKPHGSAGGELIVTARQVLGRLGERWEERLRSDIRGRTVLFIGYRGRDLDFQPIWEDVLRDAAAVVWFDRWADGEMNEAAFKRKLLAGVNTRGELELAPPALLPPEVRSDPEHNPSWDFIAWCQDRGLIDIKSDLVLRMFDPRSGEDRRYPPLPGDTVSARPAVQGMLGDYKGARSSYWRAARRPGYQWKAAYGLARSFVFHGSAPMAALLSAAVLLPPYGRVGQARELALRMRLTAWSRTARHTAVLHATQRLPDDALSVYLILRSEALRVTGSLDEAAAVAAVAREQAMQEAHEVRLAHAAFQQCFALLWADRLDEVRTCLDRYLLEYARLAGNRWTAWALFVEAGWEVHSGHGRQALRKYDEAELRFRAEGLLDGVVGVKTARLAAYRLTGSTAEYAEALAEVTADSRGGPAGVTYYTRGNDFTAESILNDQAEFIRCSHQDLGAAQAIYERTAASRYPLQSALGHLGLALTHAERGQTPTHAAQALLAAENIGCRLVAARSRELLTQPFLPNALRQVYFV
jgi:SIR2-like domain